MICNRRSQSDDNQCSHEVTDNGHCIVDARHVFDPRFSVAEKQAMLAEHLAYLGKPLIGW